MLLTEKDLTVNGCCFVSRHLWSTDYSKKSIDELKKNVVLLDNLAGIFNVLPQLDFDEFENFSQQKYNAEKVYAGLNKEIIYNLVEQCGGDTLIALIKLEDGDFKHMYASGSAGEEECSYEEFKAALLSSGHILETSNDAYLKKMYHNFLKREKGAGTTLLYNWCEDKNDGVVSVYVSVPPSAKKRDIISNLKRNSWELIIDGKVLVSGDLFAPIKVDSSFWSIESPGLFCMTLEKINTGEVWEVGYSLLLGCA